MHTFKSANQANADWFHKNLADKQCETPLNSCTCFNSCSIKKKHIAISAYANKTFMYCVSISYTDPLMSVNNIFADLQNHVSGFNK